MALILLQVYSGINAQYLALGVSHYHFDDPGPVPVVDFTARIAVVEDGPDRSAIEWTGSFEPVPGVPADEASAAVGGFYQVCLDRITTLLGT